MWLKGKRVKKVPRTKTPPTRLANGVWAWGYNADGELGDGTTTNRLSPVQVAGLTGSVAGVSAGQTFSLALKSDGTVWAWGGNAYGDLGDGTTTSRLSPVQVSGITGVAGVSAGAYHSLALKSDSTVWQWGSDGVDSILNAAALNLIPVPVPVAAIVPGAPASVSAVPGVGSAIVSFSAPVGNGGYPVILYTVTASPGGSMNTGSASPITVGGLTNGTSYTFTVTATNAAGTGPDSAPSAAVTVGPISISPGGIVNSATFLAGAPVAPGSLASVYGTFPISVAQANVTPWPPTVSGLSIQFSGIQAPLSYASATQANVQIPWEMAGQTQASVIASVASETSTAQTVNLASFAPGVFVMNAQGQGAIVDALSGFLIGPSSPATAGTTYISIYCTGLGPVTNQPATGAAASASVLSETTTPPTVMIGGVSASILFSGLAPTFVGLYQINVQVPAAAPFGNTIPLIVSIGGATAKTVTIAVQPGS